MVMLPSHQFKAAKAAWLPPPTSSPNQQKPPPPKQARAASPSSLQLNDHVSKLNIFFVFFLIWEQEQHMNNFSVPCCIMFQVCHL
jgi:hypothetical protein